MSKRVCIPGVICIENISLFIGVIILAIVVYYCFLSAATSTLTNLEHSHDQPHGDKIVVNVPPQRNALDYRDVLLNPYAAPFYDQNNISPTASPLTYGGGQSNFRQVGILTPAKGDSKGEILPLMARPLSYRSNNQWNYYTVSNQHNNVKIPLKIGARKDCKGRQRGGKDGLAEYGVNELNDGDDVFLDGYGKDFRVTVYENTRPAYTPF